MFRCGAHCPGNSPLGRALGCVGQSEAPHRIADDLHLNVCPARALRESKSLDIVMAIDMLLHAALLWRQSGVLPAAGGWLDQPAVFTDAAALVTEWETTDGADSDDLAPI